MKGEGTVEAVFVAPEAGAEMREVSEVEAVAGAGLRGDRYFEENETGTFVGWDADEERPAGYDLTLIEREAVEAIEREADVALAPGEHRRNVETRDVALNHLVGERFRVGEVVCEGVRLCEPCDHLQRVTREGVLDALVHRGGLRTTVVEGGTLRAGDVVSPL
jgi:MOSC domain-containing protein YiiM